MIRRIFLFLRGKELIIGDLLFHLKGEQAWIKKYFYVLRPILAIKWIEQGYGVSPTAFSLLLERLTLAEDLKLEIRKLIELKRKGAELDYGPRIQIISEFIEIELERLENNKAEYVCNLAPYEQLDRIFQDGLSEAWHKD